MQGDITDGELKWHFVRWFGDPNMVPSLLILSPLLLLIAVVAVITSPLLVMWYLIAGAPTRSKRSDTKRHASLRVKGGPLATARFSL